MEKDLYTTEHCIDDSPWSINPAMETFRNHFHTVVCPQWISKDGKTMTYVIRDHARAGDFEAKATRLIKTLGLPLEATLCTWNKVIDLEIKYTL